jgi:hypothetical protein
MMIVTNSGKELGNFAQKWGLFREVLQNGNTIRISGAETTTGAYVDKSPKGAAEAARSEQAGWRRAL